MHNINDGRMMYVGETPWHGLGIRLDQPATAEEAIVAAKLDYPIDSELAFTVKHEKVDNVRLIVRQDNRAVLGCVSDSYKIIQNTEAFSFFDRIVGEGQAIYHTAGALGKGERIWIMAKLPDDTIITKGDVIEKYLLLTNSHDGTSALRMYFTPVRVVCQNTLILSLRDAKEGVSIRHMGDITAKTTEARRILGLAVNYYARFSKDAHALVKYQMQKNELEAYFDYALRGTKAGSKEETATFKNERDELVQLFENGKGNQLPVVRGSAWAAYNAVTEYTDHFKTIKNLKVDNSNRLKNIWFGTGAQIKGRAYNRIMEVAGIIKPVA
jgi:phage/plasmid-like protein (TIGR03299 family)